MPLSASRSSGRVAVTRCRRQLAHCPPPAKGTGSGWEGRPKPLGAAEGTLPGRHRERGLRPSLTGDGRRRGLWPAGVRARGAADKGAEAGKGSHSPEVPATL